MSGYDNPGPLPARDGLPPLGAIGSGTERLCSMTINGIVGPGEVLCNQPAVMHIIWENPPDGAEQGYACAAHHPDQWKPLATHSLGACCGMPGAMWFPDENVCRYVDGLEVAEPVRAVAQPVEIKAAGGDENECCLSSAIVLSTFKPNKEK